MSKTLAQRLDDAKAALDLIHAVLLRQPLGLIPTEVDHAFKTLLAFRTEIPSWRELILAREAAKAFLANMDTIVGADDCISLGGSRIKFAYVRFIAVQSYVSTTWAIADSITGRAGQFLCTPDSCQNQLSPPQMVSHFISKERKSRIVNPLYHSIRIAFGWPIGLSYAIRNHFIHDGAQLGGVSFFDGSSATSGFRISLGGWDGVQKTAQDKYGVSSSFMRANATWPASPMDDLRIILDVCEQEMDDALGVIIGSAHGILRAHVAFLVGDD